MPYGRTLGERKEEGAAGPFGDGAALGEEQQRNCPGQLREEQWWPVTRRACPKFLLFEVSSSLEFRTGVLRSPWPTLTERCLTAPLEVDIVGMKT